MVLIIIIFFEWNFKWYYLFSVSSNVFRSRGVMVFRKIRGYGIIDVGDYFFCIYLMSFFMVYF